MNLFKLFLITFLINNYNQKIIEKYFKKISFILKLIYRFVKIIICTVMFNIFKNLTLMKFFHLVKTHFKKNRIRLIYPMDI